MVGQYIYKSVPFYNHKVFWLQKEEVAEVQDGCRLLYMQRFLGERIYEDGRPFVSPYVISLAEEKRLLNQDMDKIKKWEYLTFGDRSEDEYFKDGKYLLPAETDESSGNG